MDNNNNQKNEMMEPKVKENHIRENLEFVINEIDIAKKNADVCDSLVKLIAVSKTKPIADLEVVYQHGVRDFGENKVQEMVEKYEHMPKDIRWHMIGHLQRNKVKYIAPFVEMIHSLDSFRLAEEIEKQGEKIGRIIPVLVEVNIAKEKTKFGLREEEVISFIESIAQFQHIRISGLMTSAPYVDDSEENRVFFHKIKQLAVDINLKNIDNISMDFLSMGMSNDYLIAIEEGSNLVRVGTGIFGNRN